MFSTPSWGEFAVLGVAFGIVAAKVLLVGALAYWIIGRTALGRGLRRSIVERDTERASADQLQAMQSQLEELHARVDFAERLLIDQREQLRAFGIEPTPRPTLPTPV